SLLAEVPSEPNVPRRVRDSVPPAPEPPKVPAAVPSGADMPLRHLTRSPSPPSKEDAGSAELRPTSHEDTHRSLSNPARSLSADDGGDRVTLPTITRPVTPS